MKSKILMKRVAAATLSFCMLVSSSLSGYASEGTNTGGQTGNTGDSIGMGGTGALLCDDESRTLKITTYTIATKELNYLLKLNPELQSYIVHSRPDMKVLLDNSQPTTNEDGSITFSDSQVKEILNKYISQASYFDSGSEMYMEDYFQQLGRPFYLQYERSNYRSSIPSYVLETTSPNHHLSEFLKYGDSLYETEQYPEATWEMIYNNFVTQFDIQKVDRFRGNAKDIYLGNYLLLQESPSIFNELAFNSPQYGPLTKAKDPYLNEYINSGYFLEYSIQSAILSGLYTDGFDLSSIKDEIIEADGFDPAALGNGSIAKITRIITENGIFVDKVQDENGAIFQATLNGNTILFKVKNDSIVYNAFLSKYNHDGKKYKYSQIRVNPESSEGNLYGLKYSTVILVESMLQQYIREKNEGSKKSYFAEVGNDSLEHRFRYGRFWQEVIPGQGQGPGNYGIGYTIRDRAFWQSDYRGTYLQQMEAVSDTTPEARTACTEEINTYRMWRKMPQHQRKSFPLAKALPEKYSFGISLNAISATGIREMHYTLLAYCINRVYALESFGQINATENGSIPQIAPNHKDGYYVLTEKDVFVHKADQTIIDQSTQTVTGNCCGGISFRAYLRKSESNEQLLATSFPVVTVRHIDEDAVNGMSDGETTNALIRDTMAWTLPTALGAAIQQDLAAADFLANTKSLSIAVTSSDSEEFVDRFSEENGTAWLARFGGSKSKAASDLGPKTYTYNGISVETLGIVQIANMSAEDIFVEDEYADEEDSEEYEEEDSGQGGGSNVDPDDGDGDDEDDDDDDDDDFDDDDDDFNTYGFASKASISKKEITLVGANPDGGVSGTGNSTGNGSSAGPGYKPSQGSDEVEESVDNYARSDAFRIMQKYIIDYYGKFSVAIPLVPSTKFVGESTELPENTYWAYPAKPLTIYGGNLEYMDALNSTVQDYIAEYSDGYWDILQNMDRTNTNNRITQAFLGTTAARTSAEMVYPLTRTYSNLEYGGSKGNYESYLFRDNLYTKATAFYGFDVNITGKGSYNTSGNEEDAWKALEADKISYDFKTVISHIPTAKIYANYFDTLSDVFLFYNQLGYEGVERNRAKAQKVIKETDDDVASYWYYLINPEKNVVLKGLSGHNSASGIFNDKSGYIDSTIVPPAAYWANPNWKYDQEGASYRGIKAFYTEGTPQAATPISQPTATTIGNTDTAGETAGGSGEIDPGGFDTFGFNTLKDRAAKMFAIQTVYATSGTPGASYPGGPSGTPGASSPGGSGTVTAGPGTTGGTVTPDGDNKHTGAVTLYSGTYEVEACWDPMPGRQWESVWVPDLGSSDVSFSGYTLNDSAKPSLATTIAFKQMFTNYHDNVFGIKVAYNPQTSALQSWTSRMASEYYTQDLIDNIGLSKNLPIPESIEQEDANQYNNLSDFENKARSLGVKTTVDKLEKPLTPSKKINASASKGSITEDSRYWAEFLDGTGWSLFDEGLPIDKDLTKFDRVEDGSDKQLYADLNEISNTSVNRIVLKVSDFINYGDMGTVDVYYKTSAKPMIIDCLLDVNVPTDEISSITTRDILDKNIDIFTSSIVNSWEIKNTNDTAYNMETQAPNRGYSTTDIFKTTIKVSSTDIEKLIECTESVDSLLDKIANKEVESQDVGKVVNIKNDIGKTNGLVYYFTFWIIGNNPVETIDNATILANEITAAQQVVLPANSMKFSTSATRRTCYDYHGHERRRSYSAAAIEDYLTIKFSQKAARVQSVLYNNRVLTDPFYIVGTGNLNTSNNKALRFRWERDTTHLTGSVTNPDNPYNGGCGVENYFMSDHTTTSRILYLPEQDFTATFIAHRSGGDGGGKTPPLAAYMQNTTVNTKFIKFCGETSMPVESVYKPSEIRNSHYGYRNGIPVYSISFKINGNSGFGYGNPDIAAYTLWHWNFRCYCWDTYECSNGHTHRTCRCTIYHTEYAENASRWTSVAYTDKGRVVLSEIRVAPTYFAVTKVCPSYDYDSASKKSVGNADTNVEFQVPTSYKFYPTYTMFADYNDDAYPGGVSNGDRQKVWMLGMKERQFNAYNLHRVELLNGNASTPKILAPWSTDKRDQDALAADGLPTIKAGAAYKPAAQSFQYKITSRIWLEDPNFVATTDRGAVQSANANAIKQHTDLVNQIYKMGSNNRGENSYAFEYTNLPGGYDVQAATKFPELKNKFITQINGTYHEFTNGQFDDDLKQTQTRIKTASATVSSTAGSGYYLNKNYNGDSNYTNADYKANRSIGVNLSAMGTKSAQSLNINLSVKNTDDHVSGSDSFAEALNEGLTNLDDLLERGRSEADWYKEDFEGLICVNLVTTVTVTLEGQYAVAWNNISDWKNTDATQVINAIKAPNAASNDLGLTAKIPANTTLAGVGYGIATSDLVLNGHSFGEVALLTKPTFFKVRSNIYEDVLSQ